MALAACPFCASGVPWNACACRWAIEAGKFGFGPTKARWMAAGSPSVIVKPTMIGDAVILPRPPNAEGAASRPASKRSAQIPREADLPRASLPEAIRKAAQLYAPANECAYCDARRAQSAALMRARRAKQKEPTP